jgi:sterol desaturase/sphingolipid hydroxylase (fatty acid hydroxylase superfamily)
MELLLRYVNLFARDVFRLGIWLVLLTIIFVPLERLWGLRRQKVFRKSLSTDLIYYFLSSLLPRLLLILPLTALAWAIHHVRPGWTDTWAANLPFGIRFAAAMIVGEVGTYWGHRWMHEVPMLWRFHEIHHSAEEIDWLVNTRVHPVDLVFTRLCGFVPMYVLGLAQPTGNTVDIVPVLVTLGSTLWGFFIHANMRWRFGWLEYLISTPAFHHWHHTKDGPEFINKNYSAMLPWLDKLFGTLYLPRKKWPTVYGIDDPIASNLSGQLLQPFERHPSA